MERNVKIGIAVAAVAGVVVIAAIAGIVIAMLSVSDDEGAPSNGILYKGNGGTFDGDSSFTMNETQVTSCPFTKDGYHFKIWNTKADGSGTDYAPDSIAPAKTTLYAIWSDANTLDGYNLFWGNLVSVYLSETGSTTRVNIDGTGADIAPTNAVVIFTLKLEGATISMDDSEILIEKDTHQCWLDVSVETPGISLTNGHKIDGEDAVAFDIVQEGKNISATIHWFQHGYPFY